MGPAYVSTLVSFSVSILALLLVSLIAGTPILPTSEMLGLSMLMEHYGWLGAPRKRVTWLQIIGIVMMLVGVALIRL